MGRNDSVNQVCGQLYSTLMKLVWVEDPNLSVVSCNDFSVSREIKCHSRGERCGRLSRDSKTYVVKAYHSEVIIFLEIEKMQCYGFVCSFCYRVGVYPWKFHRQRVTNWLLWFVEHPVSSVATTRVAHSSVTMQRTSPFFIFSFFVYFFWHCNNFNTVPNCSTD